MFSDYWNVDQCNTHASRVYLFKDFVQAFSFVMRVALTSERMKHHADISIVYNRVTLTLRTHEKGVLTEKDTRLASEIDSWGDPIFQL